MYIILSAIGLLNGAQFFYMRSVGAKMEKLDAKMEKLSNGCFTRHMEIAKQEGQTEMTLEALHDRLDRMKED